MKRFLIIFSILAISPLASAQNYGGPEAITPNNTSYSNDTPPTNPASLEVRISQYEEEIRKINGRLEEMQYMYRQLQDKMDKANADTDFRLKELEKKNGGGAVAAEESIAAPAKPSGPGSGNGKEKVLGTIKVDKNQQTAQQNNSEPEAIETNAAKTPEQKTKEQFDNAFDLLRKSQYPEAISAFENFVDSNPKSPLASSAYYWMGESYFVQKDYENAAKKFVAGYKKYPKGAKAPETLLKLGDSLGNLSKKKEACITYDKLADEFPKAPVVVKKKMAESRKQYNCQ